MTIDYPPPNTEPGNASYLSGAAADDQPGTKEVAVEQATNVGQGAAQASQHVAGVAREQAAQVTAETGRQVKDLLTQAQSQLGVQAAAQQEKLVAGLQSLSSELASMTRNVDKPGPASDVARQASQRTAAAARWMDGKEPADIVAEITAFARRRPGAFLALAAGAGLLAGRLTRGLKAQSDNVDSDQAPASADSLTASPRTYSPPPVTETVVTSQPPAPPAPLEPPSPGVFPTPGYLGDSPQ